MNLPEDVRVQLVEQLAQWFADKRFLSLGDDPRVLLVRLKNSTSFPCRSVSASAQRDLDPTHTSGGPFSAGTHLQLERRDQLRHIVRQRRRVLVVGLDALFRALDSGLQAIFLNRLQHVNSTRSNAATARSW